MSYANHATKFEFLGDVTLGRALCAASSSFSSPSTPGKPFCDPGPSLRRVHYALGRAMRVLATGDKPPLRPGSGHAVDTEEGAT